MLGSRLLTRVAEPGGERAERSRRGAVHPDEPPPLFSSTPKHLLIAPTLAKPATPASQPHHHHHSAKQRPVRPSSPHSRWRLYTLLFGIPLIATLAIANKYYQDWRAASQAAQNQTALTATQPTSKPAATTESYPPF